MKISLLQCKKLYIECRFPKFNGYLEKIYFDQTNGKIAYITVIKNNTYDIYNISVNDIVIWDHHKILIREISTNILDKNAININNIIVINKQNKIIGKLNNFIIDTTFNILDKIYVRGTWYHLWRKYIFNRIHIIKMTPDFIQVNDKNKISNNIKSVNTFSYDT